MQLYITYQKFQVHVKEGRGKQLVELQHKPKILIKLNK